MNKIEKANGRKKVYLLLFTILVVAATIRLYVTNSRHRLSSEVQHPSLTHVEHVEAQQNIAVVPDTEAAVNTQPEQPVEVVQAPPVARDNETVAWDFFIQRYTREQTAGILGNLMQEHNFKTDDVPGGLGIAQWLGGRRLRLLEKPDPYSIHTQVEFIEEELNTTESRARNGLVSATTVEDAVYAFQGLYERCGDCRYSNRVQYAYEVLSRH